MKQAISFLSETLNRHLKNQFGLDEDRVRIGRLINQDGTIPAENNNKLVFSFVNLTQETIKAFSSNQMGFTSRGYQKNQTPLYLNLEILVAAMFDDENESLKFLSGAVEFFHENAFLEKSAQPGMPENVDKITLEIVNLSLQDADAMWSAIGAKAMPSVLYKVRVISINSSAGEITPSVAGAPPKVSPDIK